MLIKKISLLIAIILSATMVSCATDAGSQAPLDDNISAESTDTGDIQESSASSEGERTDNIPSDEEPDSWSSMQVHFIDVGQGDCTLIECGEQSMLIDAGDNTKGSAVNERS